MRTYELRVYTLASEEALVAYRTVYYPNHQASMEKLFDVVMHGCWTAIGTDFQLYLLLSYPEGADPDDVRRQYMDHPESAANMPGFDPADLRGVSLTLLAPAETSPLQ
jgi:hypothetical protein